MAAILNDLEPVVTGLLRLSAQAAVLILLILLVQAGCGSRLAARWRHALWLLVVVRLMLPVSLPSSFSIFNLARLQPWSEVITGTVPNSAEPRAAREARAEPVTQPLAAVPGPGVSSALAQPAPAAPPARATIMPAAALSWWHWIALGWLAGVVLLGARILWQNVHFYRRLRWAQTVTDAKAWKTLEECRQLMGVRYRLVLVETALVHSPALCGFLRLHLLLPENTLATLTAEELRYVFLHELAHVKRRDMLVNWLITILQVAHWFNPLIWLAFRRMVVDRELAADALALSYLEPRENVAYGQAIIKLLQNLLSPAPLPGLVGILEDKNQMKRRMSMIAKFKKTSHWPALAVAVFASLALVALTDAPTKGKQTSERRSRSNSDLVARRLWVGADVSDEGGPSPNGRYLSCVEPNTDQLGVRDLATGKTRLLTQRTQPTDNVDRPYGRQYASMSRISPDGKQIAYVWLEENDYELWLIGFRGGKPRVLYAPPTADVWGPEWSHDSKYIAAIVNGKETNQIVLISVGDGQVRVLKSVVGPLGTWLSFSPDGRHLAYEKPQSAATKNRDMYLLALDGTGEVPLVQARADDMLLGWSNDGKALFFASDRGGVMDLWGLKMEDGRPAGTPVMLRANLGPIWPMGFDNAGSFYYGIRGGMRGVSTATPDFKKGRWQVPPESVGNPRPGRARSPTWSADGKRLAYVSFHRPEPVLCVRDVESGMEQEFTPALRDSFIEAWSSDGTALYLRGQRDGDQQPDTFRFDLASAKLTALKLFNYFLLPQNPRKAASWQRDRATGQGRLRIKDLESGEDKLFYESRGEEFAHVSVRGGTLTADGQFYIFFLRPKEEADFGHILRRVSANGGPTIDLFKSTEPFTAIGCPPDGSAIFGVVDKELFRIPSDGGVVQKMKLDIGVRSLNIHPDGQQIAFIASEGKGEIWVMEHLQTSVASGMTKASGE